MQPEPNEWQMPRLLGGRMMIIMQELGKSYFIIVCKKRSEGEDLIYWLPDRSGYTPNLNQAGRYSGRELDDCAGDHFDWYALKYYLPKPEGQTTFTENGWG